MSQYPSHGYPPPGTTFPPQQGPPPGTTFPPQEAPPITVQPPITVVPMPPTLGPGPQPMTCPRCGAEIMTAVSDVAVTKTHAFAIGICLIGCALGCCLIPYCVSSCQGQRHDCPNCGHNIGLYK